MMKNVATLKTGEFVFCRYTWRSGRGAPPTWGGASPTRGGAEEEESCQEKDQKLSMDECVWVEIVWMTAIVCVTLVDCPICVPLRGSFIFLPTPFSLRDLLYLKTGICWFVGLFVNAASIIRVEFTQKSRRGKRYLIFIFLFLGM